MGVENTEKPKLKLYLRLPVKIKDEFQVKGLNPTILQVYLPRQKSRRWCFVEFETKEALIAAKALLQEQKINGKSIIVKDYSSKDIKHQKTRSLTQKGAAKDSTKPLLHLLQKQNS